MSAQNKKSGQSLIEALISITILSFVLIIFLLSLSNIMRVRTNHRWRIRASRLAQEGIELVYNVAVNDVWDEFITTHDTTIGGIEYSPIIESTDLKLVEYNSADPLIDGRYLRKVKLTMDGNSLRVDCNVSWGNDEVEYTTHLIKLKND